jgi:1-phosphofructokinase
MSPCKDVTIELDSLIVGKTNVVKTKSISLGGKGLNVAVGVARLGKPSHATGFMYEDGGDAFESALKREKVTHDFVYCAGRVRENYKFIDSRSMLTEVNDVGGEVDAEKLDLLEEQVRALSENYAVTVVSGGIPRGVKANYYERLLRAVSPKSLRIADATGERLISALRAGVDLVKPNLEELENTLGKKIENKEELLSGCNELIRRGAKRVLLSMGEDGALITDGEKAYFCKSRNVAVNSTVGAGDSMVAAVSLGMARNADMAELLRMGVAAGTAAVSNPERNLFTKEKYREIYAGLKVVEIK